MPFRTWVAGETVTAANVNDFLQKQVVIVATSTTRPSSPVDGMCVYETDTDRLLVYDGANWLVPDNLHGGTLGYAQVTADQTGITAAVDLTNLTATVTVGAGRRIHISAYLRADSSVAGDEARLSIQEGTTVLQRGFADFRVALRSVPLHVPVVLKPTAGAHTYKLVLERLSGTGTVALRAASDNPAFILVQDIGAA